MKCDEEGCYEAAIISILKDLFGKSDAMRNLCSKHAPQWSAVSLNPSPSLWRIDMDRAPEFPTEMLLWNPRFKYMTCDVKGCENWDEYTHWMPLPTAPSGSGDANG